MTGSHAVNAGGSEPSPRRRRAAHVSIDAGTHEIAAYDYGGGGGGDGGAVVFVHATGFHGQIWGRVIDFMPAQVRCISLDVRAHGLSGVAEHDSFAWVGFADDVATVVTHFQLRRPYGVGHSAGGAALALAQLNGLATFERLWLYEPVMFPPLTGEVGANPLAIAARRRRATFDSVRAARENFAAKPPMNRFDPAVLDDYLAGGLQTLPDGTVALRCRPEWEAQTYENGPLHDAYERLDRLDIGVTIVRGADSDPMWQTVTSLQADAIASATLLDFPHSGHFGPMEQPEQIARSIVASFGLKA